MKPRVSSRIPDNAEPLKGVKEKQRNPETPSVTTLRMQIRLPSQFERSNVTAHLGVTRRRRWTVGNVSFSFLDLPETKPLTIRGYFNVIPLLHVIAESLPIQ